MGKHSQEELDNLSNIAGCIIAAGIVLPQLKEEGKKAYISKKLNEALHSLDSWGYSIKPEEVDYNNPKIPDYLLIENISGNVAFTIKEGSDFVNRWYYHFTSY
ncbi:hypothetical protein F3J34_10630 [Klebsiella sp. Ap-873]|nr:hypothetical protein [Klebsiella sp. Ap-873]